MENTLIPQQSEGKQNDLRHTVTLADRKAAHMCFKQACERMRNPGMWHELCGLLSADFRLVGHDGLQAHTQVKTGDYLQVDIPGPGSKAGNGYDWVKVDKLEDCPAPAGDQELCGMQLRPCANPQKKQGTAHFFMKDATSTFIIQRQGNDVIASYHGRNEKPNVKTDSVVDNARNAVITSGAMAGLSELQWHCLIKAFIEDRTDK